MLVLVNAEKILNFIMKIIKGLPLLVKCIQYINPSGYSESVIPTSFLLVLKLYIYIYIIGNISIQVNIVNVLFQHLFVGIKIIYLYIYNYENRFSSSVNIYRD